MISTYIIEEDLIKGFIELSSTYKDLESYFGIKSPKSLKTKGDKFYTVLPHYLMSKAIALTETSRKPLDRQCVAINLFLKSSMSKAMTDSNNGFQSDCNFMSFWKSAYQKKDYLYNQRASRFIMISLSNLLCNLLHPTDPITGLPLTLNNCIEICKKAELYLNQLINIKSENYMKNINNHENELMSFIKKIAGHTKSLHAAYIEEQINDNVLSTEIIMTNKIDALKRLVKHCYNEMSYQSKKSRKGLLLREIMTKIEKKHTYSEPWIKKIVLELTKITASYRISYIFHANYGQTRSAKTLIAAILDQNLNKILPIAAIIFNNPKINIMKINEEKILHRIYNMQAERFWPFAIDDVNLSMH